MSAGVPVIASHVGGLPEVIRDGENGLLVENDEAAIAGGHPRDCRTTRNRRRQIGAAAPSTVMERFTVDRMVARSYRSKFTARCSPVIEALLALAVRPPDRQLSECLHSPLAAQPQRSQAALPLRPLPQDDRLVRQHPAGELPASSADAAATAAPASRCAIPLVEFLTGLLFFYQVSTLGPTLAALKMCVFCAILRGADLLRSGKAHPAR